MTPTKKQKERRYTPFKFEYEGRHGWLYLYSGVASFHQVTKEGQHNVRGLSIARLIKALKQCGYIALFLFLSCGVVEAKQVVIEHNDFLQMLAKTEHRDKLLNQCMAEKTVLIKLKDEQGKTISIQADQVKGLIETAETQERLGRTEEQINEALQKQLNKLSADLEREKRLSRYKSETVWLGVAGAIFLWVVN